MVEFTEGDRVRIDIPNETDPDHDRYHGLHGTIIDVVEDDAGVVTGDARDGVIFQIELETGSTADFRCHDLRSPIER